PPLFVVGRFSCYWRGDYVHRNFDSSFWMSKMAWFLLGFIVAWFMCHNYTHSMIASECERLGGFFVGKKVFKCIAVEKLEEEKK
ncbi:hypothetical protein PWB43_003996, partial [Acinetobacter baumannii]